MSLHQIANRTGLSRNTIRKWVRPPEAIQTVYQRCAAFNKLSPFHETLEQALKADLLRALPDYPVRASLRTPKKSTSYNAYHATISAQAMQRDGFALAPSPETI